MWIAFPVRMQDGQRPGVIPVANTLLVIINVLVFSVGWHPYVGPGTGFFSILTYSFGHANVWHLTANMLSLLVIGTSVNRRLGNGWYLLTYLGCAISLGLLAWILGIGPLLGASGAIFAVIAVALLLLPSALISLGYFVLFPFSLIVGLLWPPKEWVYWFIRWDVLEVRIWWGLVLVPLLELWGLYWNGWNWTNLGHLLGLISGVAAVLILPTRITMPRRGWSGV